MRLHADDTSSEEEEDDDVQPVRRPGGFRMVTNVQHGHFFVKFLHVVTRN